MAAVSATVSFVKKYPIALCGLSLVFMPTVHRLVIYFTPLLISTAIFFLAMLSSGSSEPTTDSSSQSEDDPELRLQNQHQKELAAAMEKNHKLVPQLSAHLDHLARTASNVFLDCDDDDGSELAGFLGLVGQEPDLDLLGDDTYMEPQFHVDGDVHVQAELDPDLDGESRTHSEPDPDLHGESRTHSGPDPDVHGESRTHSEPDPDLIGESRTHSEPDPDLHGGDMTHSEPDPDLEGEEKAHTQPDSGKTSHIESNQQHQSGKKQSDSQETSHTLLAQALERTLSCTLNNKEELPLQCHHQKHALQPLEAAA